jgi:hypothetical protein
VTEWTRPGKDDGLSATVGYCRNQRGTPLLYVFSTAWPGLEAGRTYTPFQFLTAKTYGRVDAGTCRAMARELTRADGPRARTGDTAPRPAERPDTHGDAAPAVNPDQAETVGAPTDPAAEGEGGSAAAPRPRRRKRRKRGRADRPTRDCGESLFRDREGLRRLAAVRLDDPAGFEAERARLKVLGVSLRGLDRALAPWVESILAERRVRDGASGRPPEPVRPVYYVQNGRTYRVGGSGDTLLANFAAVITAEVAEDDGAEVRRRVRVRGELDNGEPLPEVEVPAATFGAMDWVLPEWGTRAVVAAGQGVRDNLRAAIQNLSPKAPSERAYAHTGWRQIGGRDVYLHAGGGIGPDGAVPGLRVRLAQQLANYALPEPPAGERLRAAVRASLDLLRGLAPDPAAFTVLMSAYRPPLAAADYAAGLFGATSALKSELTALAQQHYGPAMVRERLPGHWSATPNALEVIGFLAKDALFVVDDFNPQSGDPVQLRRNADHIIRAIGNGGGRDRLNADSTLKAQRHIRGFMLMSGEDYPGGRSGMARLWAVDVPAGSVNKTRLTECQRNAASGVYAEALSGWVSWLARRPELRRGFKAEAVRLRSELAGVGGHSRVPTTAGDLLAALNLLLAFASEIGAVTAAEAAALRGRGRRAFVTTAESQADHQRDADPAERFLALARSALSSGRAHLAAREGTRPREAAGVGWRQVDERYGTWSAQGSRIGWLDGGRVHLDPDAALAIVVKLAGEQGGAFSVLPRTLHKRLHESGLLAEVDTRGGKTRYLVRRTVEGRKLPVLVLTTAALFTDGSGQSGQNGGSGPVCQATATATPVADGHSGHGH